MKKYLSSLVMLTAIGSMVHAQTPQKGANSAPANDKSQVKSDAFGPDITFDKTKHNFGKIKQGEPVKVVFEFTNSGNSNLVIKKATAGCGCTTPVWPKEPIAPGKKGKIEVGYDAKAVGNFVKDITVETNAGTTKLVITGVVEVEASDNIGNEIKLPGQK